MDTLTAPARQHRHIRLAIGSAIVVLLIVIGVFMATRSHTNPKAAACEAGWRRELAVAVSVNPASTFASQHGKWVQTCEEGFITP